MKELLHYNRRAGAVFLILAVVLCLFAGPSKAVNRASKAVEEAWNSLESDLEKFYSYGVNLLGILKSSGWDTEELENSLTDLEKGLNSPFSAKEPFETVYSQASAGYNFIIADQNAGEESVRSAKLYFQEMTSTRMRLGHEEEYQKAAEDYNRMIENLPGIYGFLYEEQVILFA